MKTPYDEAALDAERSRNRAAAKFFRRARRLWMQDPRKSFALWVEDIPDDGMFVSRLESGHATRMSQIIARGRRDF